MTMTLRDRMDVAWNVVAGRPYSLAVVAIVAIVALVLGITIGYLVANTSARGTVGLSSITTSGGTEPRQGGR
jgi:ABC-type dipeptide/oligopeptide/nickel transport system permease subunit